MLNKQIFLLLLNTLGTAIVSYCTSLYVINSVNPEVYGEYAKILLFVSIFYMFIAFGSDATSVKISKKFKCSSSHLYGIMIIRLVNLFFAIVILILLYAVKYIDATSFILILGLLICSFNLSYFYEDNLKNIYYSKIIFFERIIYGLIVVSVTYINKLELYLICTSLIIAQFISISYQVYSIKPLPKINFISLKKMIYIYNTGYPFLISAILMSGYGNFTRIIIEGNTSKHDFGIFSVAWQFLAIGMIAQLQIDKVYRKVIIEELSQISLKSLVIVVMKYCLCFTLPLILFVFVVDLYSVKLVGYIFNSEYIKVSDYLFYIALYYVVINLDGLNKTLWLVVDKRKYFLYLQFLFVMAYVLVLFYFDLDSVEKYLKTLIVFQLISALTSILLFSKVYYSNKMQVQI